MPTTDTLPLAINCGRRDIFPDLLVIDGGEQVGN